MQFPIKLVYHYEHERNIDHHEYFPIVSQLVVEEPE